jgi:hypothetical protein
VPVEQPGEGTLDSPALVALARAVPALAPRDHRLDAALPDESAVLVVVVAGVRHQPLRSSPQSSDTPTHRRHKVEQSEQLRDAVAVAARERPGERDAAAVYKQVLLAATTTPVDRAGTRLRAPFFACT